MRHFLINRLPRFGINRSGAAGSRNIFFPSGLLPASLDPFFSTLGSSGMRWLAGFLGVVIAHKLPSFFLCSCRTLTGSGGLDGLDRDEAAWRHGRQIDHHFGNIWSGLGDLFFHE